MTREEIEDAASALLEIRLQLSYYDAAYLLGLIRTSPVKGYPPDPAQQRIGDLLRDAIRQAREVSGDES